MTKTAALLGTRQQKVRKMLALVVMIALASVSIAQVERSEADALSSFDSQLLSLINEYRGSRGLNPLIEYAPLSNAALNWSNSMLARRNALTISGCPSSAQMNTFLGHDSWANIESQGVPPNTTLADEAVAWSCGFTGSEGSGRWTYSGMPAKCLDRIDYTTALIQFCGWVNSAPHRQDLESTAYVYIGLGSVVKWTGRQGEPLSTARYATAPMLTLCDGSVVTIDMNKNGGNGNGTNGDDVILGTPGDDEINGFGGRDKICAGAGRDFVHGGGGVDRIFGGSGIDRIWGDAGHDTIYGDGGSDRIRGGSGSDTVWAGSGADRVWGGPGSDTLHGMGGQDFIWGGAGDDTIQGNFQTDWLYGGADNDTIYAAGGKDRLFGDSGNDQLFGGNNTDFLDGGSGVDIAHGGKGKDSQFVVNVSGCVAETTISC